MKVTPNASLLAVLSGLQETRPPIPTQNRQSSQKAFLDEIRARGEVGRDGQPKTLQQLLRSVDADQAKGSPGDAGTTQFKAPPQREVPNPEARRAPVRLGQYIDISV